ncbi:MAG: Response regulator PleD [Myxococcota bacterium]|nr:Response regulator PleD [Myxococcota bacterium]
MSVVLIIDDSITIRQGIKIALKKASLFDDYLEAREGREALDRARSTQVDLILCDVVMPEMDGFQFLEELKKIETYRDTPVIMLTGQESVEKKIRGLELGASDYLIKPFDSGELIARVKVQLKIKQLQDDLREANERYRTLSLTDYLTGLYNRRHFMDMLQQEYSRCRRHNAVMSLLIADVDHFKSINDRLGHLKGDEVLSRAALVLKDNLRGHDTVARFGGEEFSILLPMTNGEEAAAVADKLRRKIESELKSVEGLNGVTASFGVAAFPSPGLETLEHLINAADKAMYRAKEMGRNRVVLYAGGDPPAFSEV